MEVEKVNMGTLIETETVVNVDHYEFLLRVNQKNPSNEDKKQLQKHLDENPELWEGAANLSNRLGESIVKNFSDSHFMRESYKRKLAAMRDNLGWNDSSEIEKILIEQVCLNWLRHSFIETAHYEKTRASHTTEAGLYWDKILTGAQKRYLRACESLAKVRKLLAEANLRNAQAKALKPKPTPTLPINFGEIFKRMGDELKEHADQLPAVGEGENDAVR